VLQPVPINNWTEFVKLFGESGSNGSNGNKKPTYLASAVYGFFQNCGTRCYVVNLGDKSLDEGLDALDRIDEIAIVAAPGFTDYADYEVLITHCENLKDRVAILDAPEGITDLEKLIKSGASEGDGTPEGVKPPSSAYATFYFPWVLTSDPLHLNPKPAYTPPSGHIAGIWARSDANRGVHKAPANEPVNGALGVPVRITDDEQGGLNQAGVNCIRFFSREGVVVWGARTLAADPEWRYLNVRRLFNMIEESIKDSTRWIVFEPNDETLWKAIRRDVTAFLTRIWRTGALMGGTPDQAFFVKCDAETNPPEEIDAGKVTIVIGIAPVKPAEFVVFEIGQLEAGSQVTEK